MSKKTLWHAVWGFVGRKTIWQFALIAVIVGMLCIVPPILAAKGSLSGDTWFQLISVVLSWPVAFALVSLIFISRFHSAIDHFLRNIGSMKLPGGIEVQKRGPEEVERSPEAADDTIMLTAEDQEKLRKVFDELHEEKELSDVEKKRLEETYRQALRTSISWKFSYLSLFFVPDTKNVLRWFSRQPQSPESFHAAWQAVIPNPSQREIILSVLVQHGMLHQTRNTLSITEEGYAFLQFIGAIPYLPATTT